MGGAGHGLLSRRGMADAALVYAAHAARFLAPLLLYPVLTRRLGLEGFGVYAAATSLAMIVSVVIDHGVSLSGPRDVALAERDRGALVGRILALRLILVGPVLLIGGGLALASPATRDPAVASAAILLGLGQGASVLWFFQGMRTPGPAAVLEVGGVLLAAVMILCLPGLGPAGVLVLQAGGAWAGAGAGLALMMRRCRPVCPRPSALWSALTANASLALSRGMVTAYTGAAIFLVAVLAGPAQAAIYGVADRIVAAGTSFLRPLAGLAGPRIAGLLIEDEAAAFRTARWSLALLAGVLMLAAVGLQILAPLVVRLLTGEAFTPATEVLRWMAIILPLVGASQVLGLQLMTPLGMDGRFALMVAAVCTSTLGAAVVLVPMMGAVGMAWARILGEGVAVAACLAALKGRWSQLFLGGGRADVAAA